MRTIKTTIAIVLTLLFLPAMSHGQGDDVTLEFESSAASLETVKNYTTALQEGDANKMNSQFAPNAMIYGLGDADSLNVTQHKTYMLESITNFNHSFSNQTFLPVKVNTADSPVKGEWVLSWGVNTLTEKETDKKIQVPYHTSCLIENGKITEMYFYYNRLNIVKNLGYTITPPTK